MPDGAQDIRRLSANAALIFHAQVLSITSLHGRISVSGEVVLEANVADLKVDRWYKGAAESENVQLRYVYPGFMGGHDCIDLERASSWLIFAKRAPDGTYEFSDDCDGGLPMSSILAPEQKATWIQRLQQDLIAGLHDPDPDLRLANIARLGALRLPSSGSPLREFVENGSEMEALWATYAALRSGDADVFPRVESMLLEPSWPEDLEARQGSGQRRLLIAKAAPQFTVQLLEVMIRYEVGELKNPEGIPMLARIARSTKEKDTRSRALSAIRYMYDPRALGGLVDLLSDPDPNLKSEALYAIRNITAAPACTLDEGEEASVESCKTWWKTEGSLTEWPAPSDTQP
jgi:hypothetical protein